MLLLQVLISIKNIIIEGNNRKSPNNGLSKKIESISLPKEAKEKIGSSADFFAILPDKRRALEVYSSIADCFCESSLKSTDY